MDRSGFTFNWQPGKTPTLTKGDKVVAAQPSFNVPIIYASTYFQARKAMKLSHSAGGNSLAAPSIEQVIEEEMQGLEDLIPPPPPAFGPSEKQTALEETPKLPSKGRSCP